MKNTNSLKRSYMINKALTYFFLILGAVIMIFPFLWMILTSSKTVPESMGILPWSLVQHCVINGEYCTCYFCQHCVVVNQRCHRIASFLRLVLTKISGTLFTIIYAMLY